MREVRPRVAVLAVVLADRSPLPLAEVRTPLAPRHSLARLTKTLLFGGDRGRRLRARGLGRARRLGSPRGLARAHGLARRRGPGRPRACARALGSARGLG